MLSSMGYNICQAQVTVRLSSHNDERDDRDEKLWDELQSRISDLIGEPRYADIAPTLI